jgi:hypothetical protein
VSFGHARALSLTTGARAMSTAALVNYVLRLFKWESYLRSFRSSISLLDNFKIFISGFARAITLPAKQ